MGTSGLQYAVQIGVHLLDPSRPESSAAFVGKLIIVFVKKVIYTTCGEQMTQVVMDPVSVLLSVQHTVAHWYP